MWRAIAEAGTGLTETTPLITLMTTRDGGGRHGSIGRLLATFEARLVDTETGEDVTSANQAGELWVRGPSVMKGYYKNPEATTGTFAEDAGGRWFKTGDSAVRDDQGFYRIADRLKELIKYKGFQGELRHSALTVLGRAKLTSAVAPAELEDVLLTHPSIADTAVIGVYEEDQATELPRAYIVPKQCALQKSKSRQAFEQEIQNWIAGKVANHKRLRGGVVVIDAIPKSCVCCRALIPWRNRSGLLADSTLSRPTGKILRKNLRKLVEEEKAKQGARAKL